MRCAMTNHQSTLDPHYVAPGFFARLFLLAGAVAMLVSWSVPFLNGVDGSGRNLTSIWAFYAVALLTLLVAIAPKRSAPAVLWGLRLASLPVAAILLLSAVGAIKYGFSGTMAYGSLCFYVLRATGGFAPEPRCIPKMITALALVAFSTLVIIAFYFSLGLGFILYVAGAAAMFLGAVIWRLTPPSLDALIADAMNPTWVEDGDLHLDGPPMVVENDASLPSPALVAMGTPANGKPAWS